MTVPNSYKVNSKTRMIKSRALKPITSLRLEVLPSTSLRTSTGILDARKSALSSQGNGVRKPQVYLKLYVFPLCGRLTKEKHLPRQDSLLVLGSVTLWSNGTVGALSFASC